MLPLQLEVEEAQTVEEEEEDEEAEGEVLKTGAIPNLLPLLNGTSLANRMQGDA